MKNKKIVSFLVFISVVFLFCTIAYSAQTENVSAVKKAWRGFLSKFKQKTETVGARMETPKDKKKLKKEAEKENLSEEEKARLEEEMETLKPPTVPQVPQIPRIPDMVSRPPQLPPAPPQNYAVPQVVVTAPSSLPQSNTMPPSIPQVPKPPQAPPKAPQRR